MLFLFILQINYVIFNNGDIMFDLEYLKSEFSESEFNNLLNDINENFPKYKKAIQSYYESNNDKFPFDDYSFNDDVLLVIFLNEYGYDKNIVLKVLDNMLLTVSNGMEKVLILNFLSGFGVIDENEMNERNPYSEIISKN